MTHELAVESLSVAYPGRKIIDGLSIAAIPGGVMTALVGPNAAGKTTLLRGLAGLQRAAGSVRLDGTNLLPLDTQTFARHVTYMPQALPQRVALTVFEAVLSALHASRPMAATSDEMRRRAMATLERLGIPDLAMRPLDQLSGGQRQMASLAQAVAREPSVLLLDEPTSALDLRHQLRVMQVVGELTRERGMVTVLVLHDIALAARWCQRLIVLSEGAIAADGTPSDALTPRMFEHVYGVAARIEPCSRGFAQIIVDDILDRTAEGRAVAARSKEYHA
jgi:iron complex transport system ATP-binding protein